MRLEEKKAFNRTEPYKIKKPINALRRIPFNGMKPTFMQNRQYKDI